MGTINIVNDIINTFIATFENNENIDKKVIVKIGETLNGEGKVTSAKIESIIYDESDNI